MKTLRTLSLSLLAVAAGCADVVKLDPPKPAPSIDSFTASDTLVKKGTQVTLSWRTMNAATIELGPAGGTALPGLSETLEGSTMVTIDQSTLFVLAATNTTGVRASAPLLIQVEGEAQSLFFAALPELVDEGQQATLAWSAPGARTVALTGPGGVAIALGDQTAQGTVSVTPTATSTYTFTADGASRTATVSLKPRIVELGTSAAQGKPGDMITVSWKAAHATKLTLSAAGRGPLVTETDTAKIAQGSFTEALPEAPTGTVVSYTLVLEGAGAPVSRDVIVSLGAAPVVVEAKVPDYAKRGGMFSLTWKTANADQVSIETGGQAIYRTLTQAEATAGSLTLATPMADTDYTVVARSTRGNLSDSKTVSLKTVGTTTVQTFTATPSVVDGGTAIALAWNVPSARRLRIADSSGHLVATARGPAAETGTGTAYTNVNTTFTLTADNTLDPAVTATQAVAVGTPAVLGPVTPAPIFQGDTVDLAWNVGTNAPFIYSHGDVVPNASSTGFVDISMTGTRINFASTDDSVLRFDVPDFSTFLYGERLGTSVGASTNGFFVLSTTSPLSRATTIAIPNTTIEANFIAPFWADLQMGAGAAYWQVVGEAPERTLIVMWKDVVVKNVAGSSLTFEAKVHQSGTITFEYKTVTLPMPVNSVIGVQGPKGVGIGTAGAASNASLTFFAPKQAPAPAVFSAPMPVSGFVKLANGYLRVAYTPPAVITASDLGVSEVMFAPHPSIAGVGQWLEVTNRTPVPVDLNGFALDLGNGQSHAISQSTVVPPRGSVVFAQQADLGDLDSGVVAQTYDGGLVMADDAGAVGLRRGSFGASVTYARSRIGDGGYGTSANVDPQAHLVAGDLSTTLPHGIVCASTAPFGDLQQRGTPGRFTPCLFTADAIPVSYFDVSDAGPPIFDRDAGDDSNVVFDLSSAPFPYLGAAVTTATVSANGWILLKGGVAASGGFSNKLTVSSTFPSGSLLAPFWDDLGKPGTNSGNANIYGRRVAAGEDPANPQAHWLFQWHRASFLSSTSNPSSLNFEVKLFDTGVIEYHWAGMSSTGEPARALGNSATVWIESRDAGTALVRSINQPLVQPNTAVRFTPGS